MCLCTHGRGCFRADASLQVICDYITWSSGSSVSVESQGESVKFETVGRPQKSAGCIVMSIMDILAANCVDMCGDSKLQPGHLQH